MSKYNARSSSLPAQLFSLWIILTTLAVLIGAALVVLAGPLYKGKAITLTDAFDIIRYGAWIGLYAGIAAFVGFLLGAMRRRFWLSLATLVLMVIACATFVVPYHWKQVAESVPPIHDITTDPTNPPQFITLAPIRKAAPNGLSYAGGGPLMAKRELAAVRHYFKTGHGSVNKSAPKALAACQHWGPTCLGAVQHASYPHVKPIVIPGASPSQAYKGVLAVAHQMHWKIASANRKTGHIEATATTFWFGFKDDVAINISNRNSGSIVNVRSESRLGFSDLGKNAARVRHFTRLLLHRLLAEHAAGKKTT